MNLCVGVDCIGLVHLHTYCGTMNGFMTDGGYLFLGVWVVAPKCDHSCQANKSSACFSGTGSCILSSTLDCRL
jgi:hypothetical protein